jgi:hypothetical protein
MVAVMFIHSVYFWLRADLTPAEVEQFLAGARSLLTIPSAAGGWLGAPAGTDRPVIERSYSYALVMPFVSEQAHDAYQVHPLHDRFRVECGQLWSRLAIYDVAA